MLVSHQVNKPTLPLASGEYSPATGVAIVSIFAAMVTKFLLFEKKNWNSSSCVILILLFVFMDHEMPEVVSQSKRLVVLRFFIALRQLD